MFPERRAERRRRRARQKSLRADFSHPGPGGKTRCSGDSLLSFFCQLHCNFVHTGVFIWVFFLFFIQSATLESQTVPNSSAGSIPRPDYKVQLLHTLVPPVNRHGFHGSVLQLLGAARLPVLPTLLYFLGQVFVVRVQQQKRNHMKLLFFRSIFLRAFSAIILNIRAEKS